ncbi:ThiF family adenylyltransferase [Brachybacterium halotolerans subsp. kimchii]|uniref:ThiF family adenylyltransferase n=1 Tax=Brachybacterium halotolerans TaxID=2795215 RepID=UPI001E4A5441|nr:ThiF family adenylyltransferase [Brachybacterium halotolerans]UEJ82955.1 ThiF family adenylyltransferase [Brachybacterium halotolerans subsp. kimchii]
MDTSDAAPATSRAASGERGPADGAQGPADGAQGPAAATPVPLVAPGAPLSPEQSERARRQLALPGFDETAQRRLAAARVLVIGAGGLGTASVPYLVGAGVGTIGIVDDDVVDLVNLHRQVAHRTADVGRAKTSSLADAARALDPAVRVHEHRLRLTAANALDVLSGYDLVLDGSDNYPTRYLVNDAAQLAGIPLVWGAILQHHGQVSVAWHEQGPGYRDLFPAPPAPEDVVSCTTGGVLPGLCGTVGSLMATEALKLICGIGRPLIGRVLVYDALAARTREIPFARDPQAQPVTSLVDYELFCAGPDAPPSIGADELAALLRAARGASAEAGAGADARSEADARAGADARAEADGRAPWILDVRDPKEAARLRIPGAHLLPLAELEARAEDAAGTDLLAGAAPAPGERGPLVVHCERDPRSVRAARLLAAHGGDDVRYLRGGIQELDRVAPDLLTEGEQAR